MVFPARTLALIVLGSTGVSAWGQVDAASVGRSAPNPATASAPAPLATAVAVFPDVIETRPHRTRIPTRELLDGNPYGNEVARLKAPENLSGPAIDEENPYGQTTALAMKPALEPDFENPYASAPR